MNADLPPGYDAWVTGGDPHTGLASVQCENQACDRYAVEVDVPALIEYGVVADYSEICSCCFEYSLVSAREILPPLDELELVEEREEVAA